MMFFRGNIGGPGKAILEERIHEGFNLSAQLGVGAEPQHVPNRVEALAFAKA